MIKRFIHAVFLIFCYATPYGDKLLHRWRSSSALSACGWFTVWTKPLAAYFFGIVQHSDFEEFQKLTHELHDDLFLAIEQETSNNQCLRHSLQ